MNTKTSKTLSKRIKITKHGKLIRRPMGVSHFKTRKSSKRIRHNRSDRSLDYPRKAIVNY